jgi:predicted choloylglycine hydrolase
MLKNYFEFTAKNNFELGLQMGRAFKRQSAARLKRQKREGNWKKRVNSAKKFLSITEKYFPHLVGELRGYALGAKINFADLWTASLEDEMDAEKCTSMISNGGKLVAHSEDFPRAKNDVAVVKKTVGDLTIFEIFYFNTLGGNAVSINSNGYVVATNSLYSRDRQIGVPKNVISRWLSETVNPKKDFLRLKKIRRASAYNYNFTDPTGNIFNLETTAKKAALTRVASPFAHTNHYLSALKKFDTYKKQSSPLRLAFAKKHLEEKMTLQKIKYILGDVSQGKTCSVRNKETIGNIIFDLENRTAYIWLLRENKKGFVKFNLDFVKQ